MRANNPFIQHSLPILILALSGVELARADAFSNLLPTPAQVTHRAVQTGIWNSATTWDNGVPTASANSVVEIPTNITVSIGNPYTNNTLAKLVIYGTLNFTASGHGELKVDTLLIPAGGTLKMGTDAAPLASNGLARITIANPGPIDTGADPFVLSRGVIAKGRLLMAGAAKTPFVALAGNALIGTTTLTLAQTPGGWMVGDELVVAATTFSTNWASTNAMIENETTTISAISNNIVTLGSGLLYNHSRAESSNQIHVANLTRNAIIQSESILDITRRGHVLLMTNDCIIRNAGFLRMGRTDKRAVVTDPATNSSGVLIPATGVNPRGRYSLHFHKAGTSLSQTAAQVTGCVAHDTPGWGFVNHASYVNFDGNVAYDFDGAGFVSEDGDEAGSFTSNMSLGGTGNGEFPQTRTIFGNAPRLNAGDMGFTGEGFWFQGPDLTVTGNVAAGCKGCGYMFWCAGRFDPLSNHYTGFPRTRLSGTGPSDPICGVEPRGWSYDTNRVLIADIPVRAFSNNVAYGCFTGLKFRFVNQNSVPVYQTTGTNGGYAGEIVANPNFALVRYTISDSVFWNNLNGIHTTYNTTVDFRNLHIVCVNTNGSLGGIGFDIHTQAQNTTLTTIRIKNYLTGIWLADTQLQATNNITMTGVVENYYTGTNMPYGFTAKHQTFGSQH